MESNMTELAKEFGNTHLSFENPRTCNEEAPHRNLTANDSDDSNDDLTDLEYCECLLAQEIAPMRKYCGDDQKAVRMQALEKKSIDQCLKSYKKILLAVCQIKQPIQDPQEKEKKFIEELTLYLEEFLEECERRVDQHLLTDSRLSMLNQLPDIIANQKGEALSKIVALSNKIYQRLHVVYKTFFLKHLDDLSKEISSTAKVLLETNQFLGAWERFILSIATIAQGKEYRKSVNQALQGQQKARMLFEEVYPSATQNSLKKLDTYFVAGWDESNAWKENIIQIQLLKRMEDLLPPNALCKKIIERVYQHTTSKSDVLAKSFVKLDERRLLYNAIENQNEVPQQLSAQLLYISALKSITDDHCKNIMLLQALHCNRLIKKYALELHRIKLLLDPNVELKYLTFFKHQWADLDHCSEMFSLVQWIGEQNFFYDMAETHQKLINAIVNGASEFRKENIMPEVVVLEVREMIKEQLLIESKENLETVRQRRKGRKNYNMPLLQLRERFEAKWQAFKDSGNRMSL